MFGYEPFGLRFVGTQTAMQALPGRVGAQTCKLVAACGRAPVAVPQKFAPIPCTLMPSITPCPGHTTELNVKPNEAP